MVTGRIAWVSALAPQRSGTSVVSRVELALRIANRSAGLADYLIRRFPNDHRACLDLSSYSSVGLSNIFARLGHQLGCASTTLTSNGLPSSISRQNLSHV